MAIRDASGTHLTATNKQTIGQLIEAGLVGQPAGRHGSPISYLITEDDGDGRYQVAITERRRDMNGNPTTRTDRASFCWVA